MAELDVGKHCSLKTCKQLDFLPFQCTGCSGVYCSDHRSFDAHCCTQVNITHEEQKDFDAPTSYGCSFPRCPERELIQVTCQHCNSHFCLSHRHQQDHHCPKLQEPVPRMAKTAELVEKIQESYRSKGSTGPAKRKAGGKSAKTAAKVALMKLKMHALGDKGIPQTERLFFRVALPHCISTDSPSQAMFFSSLWTVGRVVDKTASTLNLRNENNVAKAKKLRMFHPDTGVALPMDAQLATLMEGETPLYNGGCLIMEYTDNPSATLDGLEAYGL